MADSKGPSVRAQEAVLDEFRQIVKRGRKPIKRPAAEVLGPNSMKSMRRRDGVRLKDVRRGAGLAPTA